MPDNIEFYFIFLGQILLISFYFPRKILSRIRYVVETYPPSEYPKLYPKSIEYYEKAQRNYKTVNQFIFVAGFILMFAFGLWGYPTEGKIARLIPVVFGLIQVLPLIGMEISEFNQFKLMRKADLRTTRMAELRPRRLFDFVSPAIFSMAIVMYIAFILLDLYWHQFNIDWGHDTVQRAMVITAGNLFFALIIIWNLYGKTLNPHQAYKDRTKQIGLAVKSLVFLSIAMSVFFMTTAAGDAFDLDSFEPSIASLYFQLIVWISLGTMLRTLRVDDINFEVYKEDVSVT